jgi:hypothetical protein
LPPLHHDLLEPVEVEIGRQMAAPHDAPLQPGSAVRGHGQGIAGVHDREPVFHALAAKAVVGAAAQARDVKREIVHLVTPDDVGELASGLPARDARERRALVEIEAHPATDSRLFDRHATGHRQSDADEPGPISLHREGSRRQVGKNDLRRRFDRDLALRDLHRVLRRVVGHARHDLRSDADEQRKPEQAMVSAAGVHVALQDGADEGAEVEHGQEHGQRKEDTDHTFAQGHDRQRQRQQQGAQRRAKRPLGITHARHEADEDGDGKEGQTVTVGDRAGSNVKNGAEGDRDGTGLRELARGPQPELYVHRAAFQTWGTS